MLKKLVFSSFVLASFPGFANETINLYQAPITSLNKCKLLEKAAISANLKASPTTETNTLQAINETKNGLQSIARYQQLYHGIPVIGAQIMISKSGPDLSSASKVNGQLIDEIQLNIKPEISKQAALDSAIKTYLQANPQATIKDQLSQLQIRLNENNELSLVYQVSFKSISSNKKPAWIFFVVDAKNGTITKQWNNIKSYADTGPGGNEKVHEYWYGKDGLPALDVRQNGTICEMESDKVRLVNVGSAWDWNNELHNPLQYTCDNNVEENVNGAFSPSNDAYYFGHTIVKMYRDWYHLNALQQADGEPMKLVMRVHFGQYFDNAFWDGQTMSFGDGYEFYPLVSLDIAGHEVTHGFTEQHSNLEYHDQSGALNESISDMAGQATRAFLLESNPKLYNKAYLVPNEITWGIGETIVRGSLDKAIRFMDRPSADGSSADCLDKQLAQNSGASCHISYRQVIDYANQRIGDPEEKQSYIVHSASGIFNKAFYLLSKAIGIKKAYHVMLQANIQYWTPTTDFITGACGVLYAAKDLEVELAPLKSIFSQVGVETRGCLV